MSRWRQRTKSERGAALVEAAIVTPVFFLLIFGLFEMGFLLRHSLTVDNASREGARAVSAAGDSPDTDYIMLRTVEHGLQNVGLQKLDYVTVFRASGPESDIPAACRIDSQAGLCNRYTAADFFVELDNASGSDAGNFRCGSLDSSWCASTRDTSLTGGTDFVGVHVETTYDYITNIIPGGTQVGETTILSLEPEEE